MYICIICFIYYICKYIDRYRYILHYIYVYYIYRTLPRNFGKMMFQKNWEKYCKQVITSPTPDGHSGCSCDP